MGFKERFDSEWYVSLIYGGNDAYELAIISYDHDTIPEQYRRSTSALLLKFEVPGVEAEYGRRGWRFCSRSRVCPSGSDTSICRGPGGVMVDVIEVIPPDPEHAGQYVS